MNQVGGIPRNLPVDCEKSCNLCPRARHSCESLSASPPRLGALFLVQIPLKANPEPLPGMKGIRKPLEEEKRVGGSREKEKREK